MIFRHTQKEHCENELCGGIWKTHSLADAAASFRVATTPYRLAIHYHIIDVESKNMGFNLIKILYKVNGRNREWKPEGTSGLYNTHQYTIGTN